MRVMLDTNVLISALVFNSKVLNSVIDLASRGDDHLLLSAYVIDEAREVVRRKWPNRISAFDRFIARLNFELIEAAEIVDGLFLIRDPMDYPVLYYALIGDADVFVTGDKDFSEISLDKPRVLSPSEFIEKHA